MMVVMVTPRNGFHVHSAVGVSGLVVLFLLLGGFVAMHGVAATTATGVHHNPVTVLAVTGDHVAEQVPVTGPASSMAHTQPHGDVQPRAADSTASAAAGTPESDDSGASHGQMVGCLVVLCGAIAAVVLRLFKPFRTMSAGALGRVTGYLRARPDRPPPRRSRISLGVLRV